MENRVRQFGFVCLELIPGVPDVSVLVGRVLELDDAQGQPVQEEDYVRAAGGLVLLHCELVDGQPVVVGWVCEVYDVSGFSARRPIGSSDGDGHSPCEGVVEGPITCLKGRSLRVDDVPETGFQGRRAEGPG